MPRPLFRPKTNHTCHQKPNPSGELVPSSHNDFPFLFLSPKLLTNSHYLPGQIRDVRSAAAFAAAAAAAADAAAAVVAAAAGVVKGDGRQA